MEIFLNVLTVLNTLVLIALIGLFFAVKDDEGFEEYNAYLEALESKPKRVSRGKAKNSKPVKKASGRSVQSSSKTKRQR